MIKADSASPLCTVNVSESITTSLAPFGDNVRSPVLVDIVPSADRPIPILSTTNESVIVTAAGKPTVSVTSVPLLAIDVLTSFDVPIIFRSSVSKATSCVPESASTVRAVARATVAAAVNLPC